MREFTRALPTEVEVVGRTIEGIALRWDHPYTVSDDDGATFYVEGWRVRAFERGLRAVGNVNEVRVDHGTVRVGRTSFAETVEGLTFTAVADETPPGDAALEFARAGRFNGVSLTYASDKQERDSATGVIWRTRGVPRELSLIDRLRPQYGDDARIIAVRALWVAEPTPEELQRAADLAALIERSQRNLALTLPDE
jgi:phage head maturation protease